MHRRNAPRRRCQIVGPSAPLPQPGRSPRLDKPGRAALACRTGTGGLGMRLISPHSVAARRQARIRAAARAGFDGIDGIEAFREDPASAPRRPPVRCHASLPLRLGLPEVLPGRRRQDTPFHGEDGWAATGNATPAPSTARFSNGPRRAAAMPAGARPAPRPAALPHPPIANPAGPSLSTTRPDRAPAGASQKGIPCPRPSIS